MGENTWSYFWDSLWTEVSDLTKLSVPIGKFEVNINNILFM